MKTMTNAFRASFTLVLLMTLLLGVIYPLIVTGLSQALFHHRANGSLIDRGGVVVGSSLLGQSFTSPKYFWGRLSATDPAYNAASSTGSNLSPGNPKLLVASKERIAALEKAETPEKTRIPVDLVTASASGLDPHISVEAALYQLPRVAHARSMKPADVEALVGQYTENPGFGLLGKPYVNVLRLNMALDDHAKEKR